MSQHVTTEENRIEYKNIAEDSASAAPVSPRKPAKKTAPSNHRWLVEWWCWAYQQITAGSTYLFTARDGATIARIVKAVGLGQTVERAASYLTLTDDQRWPRGSPTVTGFGHMFNQLADGDALSVDRLVKSGLLPAAGPLHTFTPWKEAA